MINRCKSTMYQQPDQIFCEHNNSVKKITGVIKKLQYLIIIQVINQIKE